MGDGHEPYGTSALSGIWLDKEDRCLPAAARTHESPWDCGAHM